MIKIVRGNDINLYVPMVQKDEEGNITAIDVSSLTDMQVKLTKGSTDFDDFTTSTEENSVVLHLSETASRGSYKLEITAKNQGVDIAYRADKAFEIVEYNKDSTYLDNIAHVQETLDTAIFVGVNTLSDAEIAALKEQLREEIAATQQAKEEYQASKQSLDNMAESLSDVATETKATQNKNVLLEAIANIDLSAITDDIGDVKDAVGESTDQATAPTLFGKLAAVLAAVGGIDFSDLAHEANATQNRNAILNAIQSIDLSALATESNATANKQALLTAIQNIDLTSITSLIGTASDTASALTLFGRIAAVIAAVGNIDFSALATEANATANKNAVIAAIPTVQQIQSGLAKTAELPTGYALQGTDPTATNTAILAAIAGGRTFDIITTAEIDDLFTNN